MTLSLFLILLLIIGIMLGAFFFLIALLLFILTDLTGAPFVPSLRDKIKTMIELGAVKSGEIVYDLGSGSGAILLAAARRGAYAIGIEINPFLVWYSRWRAKRAGLHHMVKIVRKDFRIPSLGSADVVFLYLWPKTNDELREKLQRELKAGARVVSNSFPISGWMPLKKENGVFLYQR